MLLGAEVGSYESWTTSPLSSYLRASREAHLTASLSNQLWAENWISALNIKSTEALTAHLIPA